MKKASPLLPHFRTPPTFSILWQDQKLKPFENPFLLPDKYTGKLTDLNWESEGPVESPTPTPKVMSITPHVEWSSIKHLFYIRGGRSIGRQGRIVDPLQLSAQRKLLVCLVFMRLPNVLLSMYRISPT